MTNSEPRLLIYGSRGWTDRHAIFDDIIAFYGRWWNMSLIEGECPNSPDVLGREIAEAIGIPVIGVPADWATHSQSRPVACNCPWSKPTCSAAGIRRNQLMLDEFHPDFAFGYRSPGKSTGTDDMTRRLEKAGVPHLVRKG